MGRVLIAGFTAALLLLATVLVYLLRAPRSRREVTDVATLPPPAPRPSRRPVPAPALERVVAAPEAPRTSSVGRLSGRVMGGSDEAVSSEQLTVEVIDEVGARPRVSATTKGRDFQARLPAGTYTVVAKLDDLIGKVSGVRLGGREEIQILLALHPAGVLAGRVLSDGDVLPELEVRALVAGTRHVDASEDVASDGSFSLAVAPGVYDLEIVGEAISTVRRTGVQAPAEGLEIRLERMAVLNGAIGMPPGQPCEIDDVTVFRTQDGMEAVDTSVSVDARCRFQVEDVPAGELLVRASGTGWLVEGRVVIPERGEPDFLCLNPPCGDVPVARLEIILESMATGAAGDALQIVVDTGDSQRSCQLVGDRCEVDGLTVGDRPQVWVSGTECLSQDALPPLLPGLNRVTVPCRRLRIVEGVVRQRTPGPPPDTIDVRCGKRNKAAARSFMIRTFCEASERELQYRFGGTQGWRSVALDAGAGPLLVELPAP